MASTRPAKAKRRAKPTPKVTPLIDESEHIPTDYPTAFRSCKAFGHNWRHRVESDRNGIVVLVNICQGSCKAVRTDTLSRYSGALISRTYDYPEGYTGIGWHNKDDYRLSWLEAVIGPTKVGEEKDEASTG